MKDINLIPEQYFVRQSAVRHTIAWGILLALAVFSVIGGAIWQFGRLATARKALENYTRSADSVLPLREQLQQLAQERTALEDQLERVRQLLHRKYRSGLLAHIANSMNDDIVLTDFTFTMPAAAADGEAANTGPVSRRDAAQTPAEATLSRPTAAAPTLVLKGYALSDLEFARFITSLRKGTLMPDVRLEFVQQAEGNDTGLKTFELRCTLTENATSHEPAQS